MSSPNLIERLYLYVDHINEEVLFGTLEEIIDLDKAVLEIGLGDNSDLNHVIFDLTLDSEGEYNSDIAWDTSAHSQIDSNGIVTRGITDVTANIIATISKYTESDTKVFSVTVLAL